MFYLSTGAVSLMNSSNFMQMDRTTGRIVRYDRGHHCHRKEVHSAANSTQVNEIVLDLSSQVNETVTRFVFSVTWQG